MTAKTRRQVTINGFVAEVLDDASCAIFRKSSSLTSMKIVEKGRAEPFSAKARRQLCDQAASEGFDTVVVERHIYAKYDLRCTMSARSGTKVTGFEYTRREDGVWLEKPISRQQFC